MRYGMRKPSVKKSISARTTGKLERSVKRTVNPLYGRKGMGLVNDPQKAIYNKVYSRTTFGVSDLYSMSTSNKSEHTPGNGEFIASGTSTSNNVPSHSVNSPKLRHIYGSIFILLGILFVIIGLPLFLVIPIGGVFSIVVGVLSIIIGRKYRK